MKFFSYFLFALFLLGCVHTELPFDKVKISFVEKKQQIATPSPEIIHATEQIKKDSSPETMPSAEQMPKNLASPVTEVVKTPEEKKEIAILPPAMEEKKVPLEKIQTIEQLPENVSGRVQLVKGDYKISKKVKIFKDSTLILSPGTKLTFQESGILCEGIIEAKGTELEPVVFEGTEGWDNITIIGESAQGIFHHCEIKDGLGMEIALKNKKCLFEKGGMVEGGAILYANQSKGEMISCTIKNNFSQSAIALIYSNHISIKNCKILKNEENGILNIETLCEITGNTISENNKVGLLIHGKSSCLAKDNVFCQNRAGILLREDADVSLISNRISENVVGIECQMESTGVIHSNTLEKNKFCAILCINNSKVKIEKNTIEHNDVAGIFVRNSASPIINQNILAYNKMSIIAIDSTMPTISENQISHGEVALVVLKNTKAKISQNQIQNCTHETQTVSENTFDKK